MNYTIYSLENKSFLYFESIQNLHVCWIKEIQIKLCPRNGSYILITGIGKQNICMAFIALTSLTANTELKFAHFYSKNILFWIKQRQNGSFV